MNKFRLGTLSQLIATPAEGYAELPEWPQVAPDPTVRNVEIPKSESSGSGGPVSRIVKKKPAAAKETSQKEKPFYSDEEGEEEEAEDEEEENGEEEEDEDEEEEESAEGEEEDEEEGDAEEEDGSQESENEDEEEQDAKQPAPKPAPAPTAAKKSVSPTQAQDESEEEEEDEEEEESEGSESEEEAPPPPPQKKSGPAAKQAAKSQPAAKKPPPKQDLLLDLDFGETTPSVTAPVIAAAQLTASSSGQNLAAIQGSTGPVFPAPASRQPRRVEIIDRMNGRGLVASYAFPRTVSVFQPRMVTVQMNFTNQGSEPVNKIRVVEQRLSGGQAIQDFGTVDTLSPGPAGTISVLMSVDFRDTLQPVHFVLGAGNDRTWSVSITPSVGELLQPLTSMNSTQFITQKKQLAGMNENSVSVQLSKSKSDKDLCYSVYEVANMAQVASTEDGQYWFAGQTACDRAAVLVTLIRSETSPLKVVVNCEKLVISNMLLKELQSAFSN